MRTFSKSKLMALRQCPKRLWLELHRPDLREESESTQMSFQIGHQVGDIARRIYDPAGIGALIDVESEGFSGAFERTARLLNDASQPVFEAGFSAGGALAFADVMLPVQNSDQLAWRMVEVKSTTSVKDCHSDDVGIQAFIARSSGVSLQAVALAHIDTTWVYLGDEDYQGLLKETDLTEQAFSRSDEVESWIAEARNIDALPNEPIVDPGIQCSEPYLCGFVDHCRRDDIQPEHPIYWLPNFRKAKKEYLADLGVTDLSGVPDDLLSDRQHRVKQHTLTNTVYFDAAGAASELAAFSLPAYFLDFESIQFVVPIWKGTRPYQHNVFQFSLHTLFPSGEVNHTEFLDLSGNDPAEHFAIALIAACGVSGPVYVYSAGFEKGRIAALANRYPNLKDKLLAINARVVDLRPIASNYYYHPSQQGSWSLKKVLPAVVPELSYDTLDGVQDGGMAMEAYHEAIHADTSVERKAQIERQLLEYCKLDTYALVRLWQVFSGHTELKL